MKIDQITARFQSGNSVPVDRAYITKEEWEEVQAEIKVSVLAEREACAKAAEDEYGPHGTRIHGTRIYFEECARAIRRRTGDQS